MYLLDDKYQVQSVLLWTCLDMFEFVTVICIFICWWPHLGDVPHDMLARLCLPAAGLPCKGFPCFLFHPFAFHIKYVVFSPHLHSWNVRKKIQICLLLFLELECNPVIPILRREMGGDPNLQSSIQLGPCPYQTSHDELGCWFKIYLHAQRLLIFVFDCIV